VLGSFQVNEAMNSMGREDLTYVLQKTPIVAKDIRPPNTNTSCLL
jgi:hypothetical protein